MNEKRSHNIIWTANIVDLVELLFALQEAHAFNNGEIPTKHMISILCEFLDLEMSDCFVHYMHIRARGGSRTKFLDKLTKLFSQKMDDDEERCNKRTRKPY